MESTLERVENVVVVAAAATAVLVLASSGPRGLANLVREDRAHFSHQGSSVLYNLPGVGGFRLVLAKIEAVVWSRRSLLPPPSTDEDFTEVEIPDEGIEAQVLLEQLTKLKSGHHPHDHVIDQVATVKVLYFLSQF